MKKRYFLFGSYLVSQYHPVNDKDLSKDEAAILKKCLEDYDGILYVHDEEVDDVTKLLSEFDGWNSFVEIPENHFKQLEK